MILGEETIGEQIVQLRINKGMTRAELAKAAKVPLRTLGRIENGEHLACNWDVVVRIFTGLGVWLQIVHVKKPQKEQATSDLGTVPPAANGESGSAPAA